MINNAKISVIVPAYNEEKNIQKCVNSIIAQTYKNLEIILVDDGSTDSTGLLMDELASNDKRIRVIHKTNGGLSDARNAGLDIFTGEYVGFVDSDDWIEPEMYEVLLQSINKNTSNISCCGIINEHFDNVTYCKYSETDTLYPLEKNILEVFFDKKYFSVVAWNKLFNKVMFNSIRFPKGKLYEDVCVMYEIFKLAKRVSVVPDLLYHYIITEQTISRTFTLNNWNQFFESHKHMLKAALEVNKEQEYIKCVVKRAMTFKKFCSPSEYNLLSKRIKKDYKSVKKYNSSSFIAIKAWLILHMFKPYNAIDNIVLKITGC